MGTDKAAIDVVPKPVGTDVTLLIETNKITLQGFDSSRGVLRQVEGMSYLVQGNTSALFQPIPHAHLFNFPLGPFDTLRLRLRFQALYIRWSLAMSRE